MSLQLYGHPFSSYHQKVLIALYENDVPFERNPLDTDRLHSGEQSGRCRLRCDHGAARRQYHWLYQL